MRTVSRHCHCASPADAEYTVIKGHPFSRCHAHCHVTVTVHHQLMLSTLSPRDTPSAGDIMYSVTTMSVHHQLMPSTLSLRDTLSAGDMYTVSQHCHCASPADAEYTVIKGHAFSRWYHGHCVTTMSLCNTSWCWVHCHCYWGTHLQQDDIIHTVCHYTAIIILSVDVRYNVTEGHICLITSDMHTVSPRCQCNIIWHWVCWYWNWKTNLQHNDPTQALSLHKHCDIISGCWIKRQQVFEQDDISHFLWHTDSRQVGWQSRSHVLT